MTHIIYVPGLGDRYNDLRLKALKWWPRFHGVTAEFVPMNWSIESDLASKIQRLETAIRRAVVDGKDVVVIGESAGAAIALIADTSGIKKVITICGVANGAIQIGDGYAERAAALRPAVDELRKRETAGKLPENIHSFRPAFDEVVYKKHSVAKGATEHVLWSLGHMITIVLGLTLLSSILVIEAKED